MTDCRCTSHNGFLTERGYAEVAQRSLEGLEVDAMESSRYVDRVVSVSGLRRDEDLYALTSDTQIDSQYRRFLSGY